MNRRRILVVIALAALVAGTAALVHAQNEAPKALPGAASAAAKTGGKTSGQTPEVLYDFNALPDPVKRMLEQIAAAAQSGEIENMRPVFESNELKPMVAAAYVEDPIAYWKKQSADGTGRDVLAAMLNVMSAGYVRVGTGQRRDVCLALFRRDRPCQANAVAGGRALPHRRAVARHADEEGRQI